MERDNETIKVNIAYGVTYHQREETVYDNPTPLDSACNMSAGDDKAMNSPKGRRSAATIACTGFVFVLAILALLVATVAIYFAAHQGTQFINSLNQYNLQNISNLQHKVQVLQAELNQIKNESMSVQANLLSSITVLQNNQN